MKYFKNENLKLRTGEEGCFIKVNGKESKATPEDKPAIGFIAGEGEEIAKDEYDKD